jgi:hypothetical protein
MATAAIVLRHGGRKRDQLCRASYKQPISGAFRTKPGPTRTLNAAVAFTATVEAGQPPLLGHSRAKCNPPGHSQTAGVLRRELADAEIARRERTSANFARQRGISLPI